ncbi:MAG: pentapeptide repeat-containing protein [Vicinamibacterales bacterium]
MSRILDQLGKMSLGSTHAYSDGKCSVSILRKSADAVWTVEAVHKSLGSVAIDIRTESDIHGLLHLRKRLPIASRSTLDIVMRMALRDVWSEATSIQRSQFGERLFHARTEAARLVRRLVQPTKTEFRSKSTHGTHGTAGARWGWSSSAAIVGVIALLLSIGFLYIATLAWADNRIDTAGRYGATISALGALAQCLGGAALFFALFLSQRQIHLQARAIEETSRLAEQGQITDRLQKALELLSNPSTTVAMGGIIALTRIARDSPQDHSSIVRVFIVELRKQSKDALGGDGRAQALKQEVFAAIAARLHGVESERGTREPLHFPDLSGIDLRGVVALGAELSGSNLAKVRFDGATLRGAHFSGATLEGVSFRDADLRGAVFGAFEQDVGGSTLRSVPTSYRNIDFRGADLFYSEGLTEALLAGALIDASTSPPTRPPPDWWASLLTAQCVGGDQGESDTNAG